MRRNLDDMINGDLAALGENSRREVPALDDALRTTDIYRDDRPGANARRDALAEERRRELVLMPLTLAHVFAHRLGRIAAGGMALAISTALLLMLFDPLMMRFAAWLVPGLNVGMLVTLSALAIVAAYVIASWIGEAWFARRMRTAIETGADAYQDLDHLARGPLEIAHAAVRKLDGLSISMFLSGAVAITLVFGYIVTIVGLNHSLERAWSIYGVLETGALQRNLSCVAMAASATTLASFVVGSALARETSLTAALPRALAGWTALVVGGVVGVVTLYNGFHMAVEYRHHLPSHQLRYALAIGATISVFVPAAWALLFWRRREHARIGS